VFDRLRDIDDVQVGIVIEDVVFGKVGVDQFALVIHCANSQEKLLV